MSVAIAPTSMNTSVGRGLTEIGISPIGGRDYRPFATVAGRYHWEVSATGTAGVDVATDDLRAYLGVGRSLANLRGRWLAFEDADAGRWCGVVTDVQPRIRDGLTHLGARSWSDVFAVRLVPKSPRTFTSTAGGHALRILADVQNKDDSLWLTDRQADESGESIALQYRGETIEALLRRLVSRTGQEWWISQGRAFEWRARVGTDRTGYRQLVEGVHVTDFQPVWSLAPVRNDLFATPADERYERARGFNVEDDDSIQAMGRRQGRIAYAGAVTRSTILPIARAELRRMTRQGHAYSFTVLNVDSCWSWFREGDTIRIVVPSLNLSANVRVMVRSFEADGRLLRCTGVPG